VDKSTPVRYYITKMKFTTAPTGKADGSSLKGYISTTYDQLKEVLGKPQYISTDRYSKVTCEWVLEFEDGLIATIYDWKMGATPLDVYDWHIGGHSSEVVERVQSLFTVLAD
jgi:hypothetical protein